MRADLTCRLRSLLARTAYVPTANQRDLSYTDIPWTMTVEMTDPVSPSTRLG